jgi:hypothetical protein
VPVVRAVATVVVAARVPEPAPVAARAPEWEAAGAPEWEAAGAEEGGSVPGAGGPVPGAELAEDHLAAPV